MAKPGWLVPLAVWQAVIGIGAVIGGVVGFSSIDGTVRWAALVVGVLFGLAALWSAPLLVRLRHRGRLIGLLTNYGLAVASGFLLLQEANVFNGLDGLGETFVRGVPFLGLVVLGWLISGWADRFGAQAENLRRGARWLMAIGGAILLIRVGLFNGLGSFFRSLAEPIALLWLAVLLVAVGWIWLLWRDAAGHLFGTNQGEAEIMEGILFVSPNVIGFLAFFAGPLIFSLAVSFTNWDGLTDAAFVGFDNYLRAISLHFASVDPGVASVDVLKDGYLELIRFGDAFVIGARDPFFWISLRNIVIFGLVAVPLAVAPAIGLAALLNSKVPGMRFFRAIYFLPSVAGVVGVALIWKQLYNATVGFINYFLLQATDVVNLLPGVDLTAAQPQWLSNTSTALLSVIIVFAWQTIGFNTVLFLAGMQSIGTDLYQAAAIDGAGPWTQFRRITVPLLGPTTVFVVATTTILALQLFNEPFILNAPQLPPNGPNNATLTPVIYLYQNAFERFNQGYASAIAWVLFLLIFAITLFYFRRQGEDGVLSA